MRTYTEMSELQGFLERFNYLKLNGQVAEETFGSRRYLNQRFYHSKEWQSVKDRVIVRDMGNDLGVEGYPIAGKVYIHHIEPITPDDLKNCTEKVFDPDNLICCSYNTHLALHYGNEEMLPRDPIERRPNDTCPWRKS